MKNLKRYWIAIVVLVVVCIAATAVATYLTLSRSVIRQSREKIERAQALNEIYNTLALPVHISRMMRNNTFVSRWFAAGEQDPQAALDYLQSIRVTWSVDAFIASNLSRNYYFSDGSVKRLTPDTPDVGWFFYLLENQIDMLTDVGYHNGDPTQPFLYVDFKLPSINGQVAGYVGTAVKLADFLPLLRSYRERYGIDLHFINQDQMVILSSDPAIVNTKAVDYPWYPPTRSGSSAPGSQSGPRFLRDDGVKLSVSERRLGDLGWRLVLVDHLGTKGSRLVDLALGSIVLYSVLLLSVTTFLALLYRRFQRDLDAAFAQIKTLRGIIPICASCKKIRDDQGYWNQLETYIGKHSDADLSHGICPECAIKLYPDIDLEK